MPKRFTIGSSLILIAVLCGFLAGRKQGLDSAAKEGRRVQMIVNARFSDANGIAGGSISQDVNVFHGERLRVFDDNSSFFIDISPCISTPSPNTSKPEVVEVHSESGRRFQFVRQLKRRSVYDAADLIRNKLVGITGLDEIDISQDATLNSLVITMDSKKQLEQMLLLIRQADNPGSFHKINMLVGRLNSDGTYAEISRTIVTTIENFGSQEVTCFLPGSNRAVQIDLTVVNNKGKINAIAR